VTRSALALIRLVAPTTDDARLAAALTGATGFVYLISRLGVTGARDQIPSDLEQHVRRVRAATPLPVAVGFGISTPAQAAAAARYADGVVVGSALMDAVAQGGVGAAERLVGELAAAVHA
jgi:tryptophan synthase alpha chain